MTLLRKYYEADLPTGGGIPDEVRIEKAYQLLVKKSKEAYLSSGSFSASPFGLDGIPHVRRDAISKLMVEFSDSELSIASEELARLKEDNERLRGEDDPFSLHDVLKRLSGTTKYLLDKKDYDGPDYEELEICILRANEIIRELETTPSPTKK